VATSDTYRELLELRQISDLERELRIRDREEQAARRELARVSEQLKGQMVQTREQSSRSEERARSLEELKDHARSLTEAQKGVPLQKARVVELESALAAALSEQRALEERAAERSVRITELEGESRSALVEVESLRDREHQLELTQESLDATRERLAASERSRERAVAEYASRTRELQQAVSALTVGLRQTKDDIERAAQSRAWRYGHAVTRNLARLARRNRRTAGALATALVRIERTEDALRTLPGAPGLPALASPRTTNAVVLPPVPEVLQLAPVELRLLEERRAQLAARLRERLGAVPQRASWPSVSAIVPTRNGRHHLERLFTGLIDHTDYSNFEVVIVDNASTDDSLEYLDTVEADFPIHVVANEENVSFAQANAHGAERATGELLLFLNNDVEAFESGWLKEMVCALDTEGVESVGATLLHPENPSVSSEDPLVQHRAIRFRWQDGMVKAFNYGDGEELWEGSFGLELRAPAVTAACMLISRERFEHVDGFSGGYRYGTEDVDLGLRLLVSGGESAGVGRAVLVHSESSSQNRESRDFRRLNRLGNRRLFLERWGPQSRREYRLAHLTRDPFWTDGHGSHVAITLTSLDVADGWGDWYSGHEIGDALEGLGWRVSYVERKGDHWYELPEDLDYVLSLMDPFDLRRVPEHVSTIAWIRNWTDRWLERPWFDRADILLVSSHGSAELIERVTGRQTIRFPLAVNPARFHPRPVEERLAADYVFTGNWWGKDRDIQRALAPRDGERVAIYGKDWEKIDEFKAYARGELPYEELARLYPSAKIVLDDTQGPTLPYGAVNARVFDALAAGTLVITNCESGVRELFDEEFPVWDSPETLRSALDELLHDGARREQLVRRYRETILTKHTYAHRAATLRRLLIAHEEQLTFCLKIGAPNREVAPQWGDLHYANSLASELRRRGHRSSVQTLDQWEEEAGLTYDVAIHVRGLSRYHPKPGQFNLLWSISHPADLTGEECDGYDLVAVASPLFAEQLRERTTTPVIVLEQATDPWVMHPEQSTELAHDLVYVANSRNVLRPIARDLSATKHDLAIWGANWQGLIDTSRLVGEHLPNDELCRVYGSAGIVLNDHWDDMREYGYISNRIYDALCCGAFVISDEVPGLTERFGDAVATYRSSEDLHALVDRFLGDPVERRRRGDLGRQIVLEQHTFAHRVDELLVAVEEHMREPQYPRRLRVGASG
jgi:O-antigen biosynthesis protein